MKFFAGPHFHLLWPHLLSPGILFRVGLSSPNLFQESTCCTINLIYTSQTARTVLGESFCLTLEAVILYPFQLDYQRLTACIRKVLGYYLASNTITYHFYIMFIFQRILTARVPGCSGNTPQSRILEV